MITGFSIELDKIDKINNEIINTDPINNLFIEIKVKLNKILDENIFYILERTDTLDKDKVRIISLKFPFIDINDRASIENIAFLSEQINNKYVVFNLEKELSIKVLTDLHLIFSTSNLKACIKTPRIFEIYNKILRVPRGTIKLCYDIVESYNKMGSEEIINREIRKLHGLIGLVYISNVMKNGQKVDILNKRGKIDIPKILKTAFLYTSQPLFLLDYDSSLTSYINDISIISSFYSNFIEQLT